MELGGILFGGRRCLESRRSLEQGSELLCHESGRQAGGWEIFQIMFFSHLFEPCLSDRWLCQEGRRAASA